MTYNPSKRARHPVEVAYLSDAAELVQLADRLNAELDVMKTVPARQALAHAAVILRGASNTLRS